VVPFTRNCALMKTAGTRKAPARMAGALRAPARTPPAALYLPRHHLLCLHTCASTAFFAYYARYPASTHTAPTPHPSAGPCFAAGPLTCRQPSLSYSNAACRRVFISSVRFARTVAATLPPLDCYHPPFAPLPPHCALDLYCGPHHSPRAALPCLRWTGHLRRTQDLLPLLS